MIAFSRFALSSGWVQKLSTACVAFILILPHPAFGKYSDPPEPGANTQIFPKPILKTGVNLHVSQLSANGYQLAENISLSPILKKISLLKDRLAASSSTPTLETLSMRQDLHDATQQALVLLQRTDLEVDYALAEIDSEMSVYGEWLAACKLKRDRVLNKTVIASGASNLILWAGCEALSLPVVVQPHFITPSGIVGISAGVVPSLASLYALKVSGGKKFRSENDPNMLAKFFGEPGSDETDYPKSVWTFLNQVPANESNRRTRKDQLIDRWIADASIPTFTNRDCQRQRDVLSASDEYSKSLSIDTLNMRLVMLQQLAAEIGKMKRLLLELTMVIDGSKSFPVD